MAKPFALAFYRSKAWRKSRAAYIAERQAIDGGMCEHCKDAPGYIVDHIDELTPDNIGNPNVALNHDNYQYLCLSCSNTKTFSPGVRYRLTPDGDVIPIPPSKSKCGGEK